MKTLKLDHNLALQVVSGSKTSTWRLYDDKDLSVNDQVLFIDKVKPNNPETWLPIGIGRINTVIQKRLGEIEEEDFDGHEKFTTKEHMLDVYRGYYGPQVTLETPIKIVRFSFTPKTSDLADYEDKKTALLTEVKVYADGGSRGNPGPSASGLAVTDMNDHVVVKKGKYLGVTTNNQAEYQALKYGLDEALAMHARVVHVYMDSLLVVNQMLGIFKVKNRDLWPIHTAVKDLLKQFERVSFTHVPRELNKIADAAVNEALDEAAKQ